MKSPSFLFLKTVDESEVSNSNPSNDSRDNNDNETNRNETVPICRILIEHLLNSRTLVMSCSLYVRRRIRRWRVMI